jgi:hypothetical protein
LVKRLVSQELILSFVPDAEECLWRILTRSRYQRTRDKVPLQKSIGGTARRSPYQVVQSGFRSLLATLSPAAEIRDVRGVADSVSSANMTSDPLHTRVPVNKTGTRTTGKTAVRRAKACCEWRWPSTQI